ncbi:MAG: phosphate butyryltransferase, partial [Bacteroidota bacterium]|nr:phosphate butyryltransferase [Bacteroidota bacterium]
MKIKRLDQMFTALKDRTKKRLVAVFANDAHTVSAVAQAVEMELVEGILVGDREIILKLCKHDHIDPSIFKIVHEPEEIKAASKSVQMINEGEGDLIMKGLVSTDKYMRALLNKENGLLPPGSTLSHVSVIEPANY